MMKILKYLLITVLVVVGLFAVPTVNADEPVALHLFWSKGCPHCHKEKAFLNVLKTRHQNLVISEYEVSDPSSVELLVKTGQELNVDVGRVPFTVIGEEYIIGYLSDEITGKQIDRLVTEAAQSPPRDIVSELKEIKPVPTATQAATIQATPVPSPANGEVMISLPVFGSVNAAGFSLPVLTMVVALLDGFNPCAMWVLLFLISMLLGVKDRRRMWLLGSTFIAASALVYFLFLSAWLNLFLFLGFVVWVRLIVGVFALGVGGYQLRDYLVNKDGACKVVGGQKRTRIFDKIKTIVGEKRLIAALVGMVLLAAAVNLIELVCSAGLPAIYTHVLSLSNLPMWQYYLLLLLYILVFMLDDLVVFFVAMTTLKMVGVEGKYARLSHLIGGSLVLILGFLMLFKPEWLMFG